jgi:hypothetical protein
MNLLKNKWAITAIVVVVIISLAFLFKKQLGPLFGGYEKSSRGFYYRFTEGKKLDKVLSPGYHIVYQYMFLGPDGDTLENKAKPGVEQERLYPVQSNNELEDAMQMASPGSVVEVLVPTDSLRKKAGNNLAIMNLPEGKNAKFVLRLIKILNPEQFEEYANERFMARLTKENKAIDNFAAKVKENWVLDSVKWFKYFIKNRGNSPRFTDGDEIEFNTEVYTLKGDLLINSGMEGHKYKMVLGKFSYDFVAFDAVARYLGEGEEGTFLVTSDYGYGAEGMGAYVAPYTPLLIKMKDIKKLNK